MACSFVNYVQSTKVKLEEDPSAESAPDDSECGFRLLVCIVSLHIQQHGNNIYRSQLSQPPHSTASYSSQLSCPNLPIVSPPPPISSSHTSQWWWQWQMAIIQMAMQTVTTLGKTDAGRHIASFFCLFVLVHYCSRRPLQNKMIKHKKLCRFGCSRALSCIDHSFTVELV